MALNNQYSREFSGDEGEEYDCQYHPRNRNDSDQEQNYDYSDPAPAPEKLLRIRATQFERKQLKFAREEKERELWREAQKNACSNPVPAVAPVPQSPSTQAIDWWSYDGK